MWERAVGQYCISVRIQVCKSDTEPVIRIMDEAEIEEPGQEIVISIKAKGHAVNSL